MKLVVCLNWIILVYIGESKAGNILGIFPIISKSHNSVHKRIFKALAARGHQVTFVSGFPEQVPPPNYRDIDLSNHLQNMIDSHSVVKYRNTSLDPVTFINSIYEMEKKMCDTVLSSDHIREVVRSKVKMYDLIIAEMYHVSCYATLAAYLDVPIIWIVAVSGGFQIDYFTGNPNNPAYIPNVDSGFAKDLNFYERVMSVYQYVMYYYYHITKFDQKSVDLFNDIYNTSVTTKQLYQKPNMAFCNSHYTVLARPNVPNVIEIGGVHIEKEKPLPQDIKQFIESAEDGVIFFSFGTSLKASSMPTEKLKIFSDVFARIPQKVLWRCDIQNLTVVTDNVMLGYWFPQRDILAHKNVKLFISHGGLLGTYETIHTGTPVIGIPFLYDQYSDIRMLEKEGGAIYLDYDSLTNENLYNAINKIINEKSYRENIEKLSKTFRDRPMTPLDTAVYWTEYTLRHNGSLFSKSPALNMPLYQYLLLDVLLFIVVVCLVVLCAIVTVLRKSLKIVKHYLNIPATKIKLN